MKIRSLFIITLILLTIFSYASDKIDYTIKFIDVPNNLTLKIYDSNQKLMNVFEKLPNNLALSYKEGVYNCHILKNAIEIYNFILKKNTEIKNTNIPDLKYIQKTPGDRFYHLNGMYFNLKIKESKIPGPILYMESPQLDVFDKDQRMHIQPLTDVSKEFNQIYEGFSKIRIRIKWDSATDKEIYILHTLDSKTPKLEKMKYKEDYYQYFTIMPFINPEADYDHWYQIICGQKMSPKYPILNYMTGDYDIAKDIDSYQNAPLYKFTLNFYMLPINKWDKIFIKHNLNKTPEFFKGYDRQLMDLVDKRRMKFNFEIFSRKGQKFFEIWAEDIETGELKKLYSNSVYLDKNTLFEYDYDNKPEKNVMEKIFPYFLIILILLFIYPYIRKYFILFLNRLSEKTFKSILAESLEGKEKVIISKYDDRIWDWLKLSIPNLLVIEKDSNKSLKDIEKISNEVFFQENILVHLNILKKEDFETLLKISDKDSVRFYVLCDIIKDNINEDITFVSNKENCEEFIINNKDNRLKIYIKNDKVLRWDKETS